MHCRRGWPNLERLSRLRRNALAERAHDLMTRIARDDLRLRAGGFDGYDLRGHPVGIDREMLRPDTEDNGLAVRSSGRRTIKRDLGVVARNEIATFELAVEHVHRRRADKAGNKEVGRTIIE